eukprot:SAG31_NODE_10722_length_1105_cov_5.839960_1_plen_176_part_00
MLSASVGPEELENGLQEVQRVTTVCQAWRAELPLPSALPDSVDRLEGTANSDSWREAVFNLLDEAQRTRAALLRLERQAQRLLLSGFTASRPILAYHADQTQPAQTQPAQTQPAQTQPAQTQTNTRTHQTQTLPAIPVPASIGRGLPRGKGKGRGGKGNVRNPSINPSITRRRRS